MPSAGIVNKTNIVVLQVPTDVGGAAVTSDWVSLKNFGMLEIVYVADIGTVAEDTILTLLQATDVSGAGSKALTVITDVWQKQGATAISAIGVYTHITQTAANTYTSATGGENEELVVIPVDPDTLDVAGGFDCVSFTMADPGTVGKLMCALAILSNPRYATDAQLSAIID